MKKTTNRKGNTTAGSITAVRSNKSGTTIGSKIPKGHIVRSLREILGETIPTRSKMEILAMAKLGLNPSRYQVVDTVGRTKNVLLRPRFHNVRNKKGQFVSKK